MAFLLADLIFFTNIALLIKNELLMTDSVFNFRELYVAVQNGSQKILISQGMVNRLKKNTFAQIYDILTAIFLMSFIFTLTSCGGGGGGISTFGGRITAGPGLCLLAIGALTCLLFVRHKSRMHKRILESYSLCIEDGYYYLVKK